MQTWWFFFLSLVYTPRSSHGFNKIEYLDKGSAVNNFPQFLVSTKLTEPFVLLEMDKIKELGYILKTNSSLSSNKDSVCKRTGFTARFHCIKQWINSKPWGLDILREVWKIDLG